MALWLTAAAILVELSLPFAWRTPVAYSLLVWIFTYLALRFIFFSGSLWMGLLDLQVSIIEMFFLGVSVFLAHRVANDIQKTETAHRFLQITQNIAAAPGIKESEERIRSELTRSRHYHRPLSVVVIEKPQQVSEPALERMVVEIKDWVVRGYIQSQLSQILKHELRPIDIVMTDSDQQRLILLCPEVDGDGVNELTDHLKMAAVRELGLHISCGVASFPDESLTFDGLMQRAAEKLGRHTFSQDLTQSLSQHNVSSVTKD
ncbi:MAG TPA: hypothetical protein VLS48_07735 [Anaerolineales bacterium]|nr:hypothetical protein [Anaerolineales bacterium]